MDGSHAKKGVFLETRGKKDPQLDVAALIEFAVDWVPGGVCYVGKTMVALSTTTVLLKVTAVDPTHDTVVFEEIFDKRKLVTCGFDKRFEFKNIVKIISAALEGGESFSAQLVDDSHSDDSLILKITQAFPGFPLDYTLPLTRKPKDETDALRVECRSKDSVIAELRQKCHHLEAENTELKKRIGALMETMKSTRELALHIKGEDLVPKGKVHQSELTVDDSVAEYSDDLVSTAATHRKLKTKSRVDKSLSLGGFELQQSLSKVAIGWMLPLAAIDSGFCFDTRLRKGRTQPQKFYVSMDRITATNRCGGVQIVLQPAMRRGTHVVTFRIDEMKGPFVVGVTDDCSKGVYHNCGFSSGLGNVYIGAKKVASDQAFGGWQKGDCLKLTAFLDSGKVCIEAPNGNFTADWKPLSMPVWFGFYSSLSSVNTLSIV